MEIHFTARHFRAHPSIKEHAVETVKKLGKFFDGIRRCDIILNYERSVNSLKIAEICLHVNRTLLTAVEESDDFHKSIEVAIDKLERQLETYKSKLRSKNKKKLLRAKAKIV